MSPPRQIYWSSVSIKDMGAIGRHIAIHSQAHADQLLDQVAARVKLPATYPHIGTAGTRAGTRELVVQAHYLVIYRVLPAAIRILRVKHAARKRMP